MSIFYEIEFAKYILPYLYMSSGGQTITGYNFFKEESGLPGTSGEKKVSLIK